KKLQEKAANYIYIEKKIEDWDYKIVQIPRSNIAPIPAWLTDESKFYPIAKQDKLSINIYECHRWKQYHLVPGANASNDNWDKAEEVIESALKEMGVDWLVI
ncbi:MAG: hypothetical protein PUP93_30175, partial [Rhizonema sp. NSF051]|nr:hypothetical protein [Rhizonema sp. NSF051]